MTAANKAYDGTTTATLTQLHADGVVGGDAVTLHAASATFDTASVGTGKTVTVTGLTLDGAAAANYTLTSATATTTADITAVSADGGGDGGEQDLRPARRARRSASCTLSGRRERRDGDAAARQRDVRHGGVGAGKTVTVSGLTLERRGGGQLHADERHGDDDGRHHGGEPDGGGDGGEQDYDGTMSATLTSCTLSGVVGGDVVTCTGGAASFATAGVGMGKTVTVERADAERRGGRQLHAGEHHGDDDRRDHGGEPDAGGDGGEQAVRRHATRDAHQLHAERASWAPMW